MDIIKRQWLLITILLITVVVNGALAFFIFSTSAEVEKQEDEMKKEVAVVNDTIEFQIKEYGLTDENKTKAQENKKLAWSSYDKDYNTLISKFGVAVYEKKYASTRLETQDFIQQKCADMRQDLEARGVKLSSGVESFTFSDIVGRSELPPKENIEYLIRNMLIVADIVTILYQSDLIAVESFTRSELKLKEHEDVYKYLPFSLRIKGNYGAIRKFINQLNDPEVAGYMYIIRRLDMTATDVVKGGIATGTAGGDSTADASKSKSARIAFNDMAQVSAEIQFDYIELMKKEPN